MVDPVLLSSAKDNWGTPQAFFDRLNSEFHFALDAAAEEGNAKCKHFISQAQNALSTPWEQFPARTDTVWFHDIVWRYASEIRFVRGRLKFEDGRRASTNSSTFPSMVVVFSGHQEPRGPVVSTMPSRVLWALSNNLWSQCNFLCAPY